MTKAEAYDKAWRLGCKGHFSLVDEIYHLNYKSIDYRTGIEANIEDDKVIVSTLGESVVFGPCKALFEGEDFVYVEGFAKRQFNPLIRNYDDGFELSRWQNHLAKNCFKRFGFRP